jgi:hypothetical protein
LRIRVRPALHKWQDLNYLKGLAGSRTVPVEMGRDYLAESWTQRLMPLSVFIDSILGNNSRPRQHSTASTLAKAEDFSDQKKGGGGWGGAGGAMDGVEDWDGSVCRGVGGVGGEEKGGGRGGDGEAVGYLAQHDLFEQIPRLRADIVVPDYTAISLDPDGCAEPIMNAWLGPARTVSPLHFDAYQNLFVQVVGRKYIRLYHPDHSYALYPYGSGCNYNSSRVAGDILLLCLLLCDSSSLAITRQERESARALSRVSERASEREREREERESTRAREGGRER